MQFLLELCWQSAEPIRSWLYFTKTTTTLYCLCVFVTQYTYSYNTHQTFYIHTHFLNLHSPVTIYKTTYYMPYTVVMHTHIAGKMRKLVCKSDTACVSHIFYVYTSNTHTVFHLHIHLQRSHIWSSEKFHRHTN